MEKIESKTIQVEDRTHHFYCDDCGVKLGSSQEHPDGWYQPLGEFDLKWYTPDGWYKLERCLCKPCQRKLIATVCKALESVGFKRD